MDNRVRSRGWRGIRRSGKTSAVAVNVMGRVRVVWFAKETRVGFAWVHTINPVDFSKLIQYYDHAMMLSCYRNTLICLVR